MNKKRFDRLIIIQKTFITYTIIKNYKQITRSISCRGAKLERERARAKRGMIIIIIIIINTEKQKHQSRKRHILKKKHLKKYTHTRSSIENSMKQKKINTKKSSKKILQKKVEN